MLISLEDIIDEFVCPDRNRLVEGVHQQSHRCLGDRLSTDNVVAFCAIGGRSVGNTEGTFVVLAAECELFVEFLDLFLQVVDIVDPHGLERQVSVVELRNNAK